MRRALPHALKQLSQRQASPEACKRVLSVLGETKAISIQDLYMLTKDEVSDSQPEPVIPSMRYLKKVVMPDLQYKGQVEKIHSKEKLSEDDLDKLRKFMSKSRAVVSIPQTVASWRWQLKAPTPEEPPKVQEKPFGAEVGVGEDWSHLNKRRQRAREEKVARDVEWLQELAAARKQGQTSSSS